MPSSPPYDVRMTDILEKKLREKPDDAQAWLVYADALQEKGDARGEAIALGEKIRAGKHDKAIEKRYAELCRAARWPRGGPWPRMCYRVRFEQMFAELRATPSVTVKEAKIEPAHKADIGKWKEVAGASWPEGMTELYSELSGVDLEYQVEGVDSVGGGIHIPSLKLWDHAALEDELWFDFTEADSALHFIRPIDRFVPEAYTVLYLRPEGKPAEVAYHYCGETLTPAGLTYREWLELLFRSRGVRYWVQLALGPNDGKTWVEDGIAHVAKLFRDFDPKSMSPKKTHQEIEL